MNHYIKERPRRNSRALAQSFVIPGAIICKNPLHQNQLSGANLHSAIGNGRLPQVRPKGASMRCGTSFVRYQRPLDDFVVIIHFSPVSHINKGEARLTINTQALRYALRSIRWNAPIVNHLRCA